eukprot:scaffold84191_cov74-Cyclotella_meneghiniana.AAC.3
MAAVVFRKRWIGSSSLVAFTLHFPRKLLLCKPAFDLIYFFLSRLILPQTRARQRKRNNANAKPGRSHHKETKKATFCCWRSNLRLAP